MRKRKAKKPDPLPQTGKADAADKQTRSFQVPSPEPEESKDTAQQDTEATLQAKLNHANRFGHDLTQQTILQRQADPEKEEEEASTQAPIQAKANPDQAEPEEEEEEKTPIQAKPELGAPEEEEEEEETPVQAKLNISQPKDKEEKEADDVAQRVMKMSEDDIKEEEEDDKPAQVAPKVQAKGEKKKKPGIPPGFEQKLVSKKGSGDPLAEDTRNFMESRFGTDFSDVKVHQEPELASEIQAQAFTHGKDIYFNSGKYAPDTDEGKTLLAHELTHVVQQGGGQSALQRQKEDAVKNNPHGLKTAAQIEDLFQLFVLAIKQIGKYTYDESWIQGAGKESVKDEIRRRLAVKYKQRKHEHLDWFLTYIDQKLGGEDGLKIWLEKAVNHYITLLTKETEGPDKKGQDKKALSETAELDIKTVVTEEDSHEYEQLRRRTGKKNKSKFSKVEDYVNYRNTHFGDRAQYDAIRLIADSEWEEHAVIRQKIGQGNDSADRKKCLYRWLRLEYQKIGIDKTAEIVELMRQGMTPELQAISNRLKSAHPDLRMGGFVARPKKHTSVGYRLGTLSEHGQGRAVDIKPQNNNPQIKAVDWKEIERIANRTVNRSKQRWRDNPDGLWQDIHNLNQEYELAVTKLVEEICKQRAAEGKDLEKPNPLEEVLSGWLYKRATKRGLSFFTLSKELVLSMHTEGLLWGATFTTPDLHHFELDN